MRPDAPEYNLLAESADDAGPGDHFDLGLTAMLDSFDRLIGTTGQNTRTPA